MTIAKKKEKMSIADLDYWDREGKEKSKYLCRKYGSKWRILYSKCYKTIDS